MKEKVQVGRMRKDEGEGPSGKNEKEEGEFRKFTTPAGGGGGWALALLSY